MAELKPQATAPDDKARFGQEGSPDSSSGASQMRAYLDTWIIPFSDLKIHMNIGSGGFGQVSSACKDVRAWKL